MRKSWIYLLLILALAGFLRFFHLGHLSLWMDEAYSTWVGSLPIHQIFYTLWEDPHPPLFYLFLHLWMKAGHHEACLRFPSAFLGLLNTYLVYLLGKKLFNQRTGLLASLLWATSFVVLDHETQVRWYVYATFFSLAATIFYWTALEKKSWTLWAAYLFFAVVSIYFQYYAGLVIFAHLVHLTLKKEWQRLGISLGFFFLALLPWMPKLLSQRHFLQRSVELVPKLGWSDLPNFFSELLGTYWLLDNHHFVFRIGITLIVLALFFLGFLKLRWVYPSQTLFLVLLTIIPFFIPFILTILNVSHVFFFRYQIVETAYFFLLAAAFLDRLQRIDFWLTLFFGAFLLVNLSTWFMSMTVKSFERQDWKSATAFLRTHTAKNDIILVDQSMALYPLAYYLSDYFSIKPGKNFVLQPTSPEKPVFFPVSEEVPFSTIEKITRNKREWLLLCQDESKHTIMNWFLKKHHPKSFFFFPSQDPIKIFPSQ